MDLTMAPGWLAKNLLRESSGMGGRGARLEVDNSTIPGAILSPLKRTIKGLSDGWGPGPGAARLKGLHWGSTFGLPNTSSQKCGGNITGTGARLEVDDLTIPGAMSSFAIGLPNTFPQKSEGNVVGTGARLKLGITGPIPKMGFQPEDGTTA